MKVSREDAIMLFKALGFKGAGALNLKRLESRINRLLEIVDDDTEIEDENAAEVLRNVFTALTEEDVIEITTDDEEEPVEDVEKPVPEKPVEEVKVNVPEKKKRKPGRPRKEKKEVVKEDIKEVVETPAPEKKRRKTGRQERVFREKKKRGRPKKERDEDGNIINDPLWKKIIRLNPGRGYYSGLIIKKFGIELCEKEITDEMIDAVDQLTGKANYNESHGCLIKSIRTIAGYEDRWNKEKTKEKETETEVKEEVSEEVED